MKRVKSFQVLDLKEKKLQLIDLNVQMFLVIYNLIHTYVKNDDIISQ